MSDAPATEVPVPERFDAELHSGQFTEAEHLARYRFAARLARGRRVLDAGCGTAYGAAMLAGAGASGVVGVDVARAVIEVARAEAGDGVELAVGDVTALDADDDSFDLVVCFEVLEHLESPGRALAEFRRVLAPDGVLVVSSPNRHVYVPGNPHHVHEYEPEELRDALAGLFGNVELRRQHDFVVSALLDDAALAADAPSDVEHAAFAKSVGVAPGTETYTIGIASDARLPSLTSEVVATGTIELRHWGDLWHEQREVLKRQHELLEAATSRGRELTELREQLLASERDVARIPELELALRRTTEELARVTERLTDERARHQSLRDEIGDLTRSASWRLTAPLRQAKRRVRS